MILCLGLPTLIRADVQFAEKQSENDFEALRRWLNDKRMVTLKELGGDLSLSGEVRVEFQDGNQTNNGIQQLGSNGAVENRPGVGLGSEYHAGLSHRLYLVGCQARI